MKKKLFILVLVSMIAAVFLSGCGYTFVFGGFSIDKIDGSGNVITESRPAQDFDRISVLGSGQVFITQGSEESLTVETDDNLMDYILTEVRNGTLVIGFTDEAKDESLRPSQGYTFRVALKNLVGLKLTGSATMSSQQIETARFDVNLIGSGDIRIDSLTAEDVEVHIVGSGTVELSGAAPEQDIKITGSGDFDGGDLQGETIWVSIPGSGTVTVWASESLSISILGSGDVRYYGNPALTENIIGSGSVRSLGEH